MTEYVLIQVLEFRVVYTHGYDNELAFKTV